MTPELFFNIGNFIFLLASIPLIISAIKNKNSLKGFSFYGSLLTSLGMISMIIGFFTLKIYFSVIIAIPTLIFWSIVTYYNIPKKIKKYEKLYIGC